MKHDKFAQPEASKGFIDLDEDTGLEPRKDAGNRCLYKVLLLRDKKPLGKDIKLGEEKRLNLSELLRGFKPALARGQYELQVDRYELSPEDFDLQGYSKASARLKRASLSFTLTDSKTGKFTLKKFSKDGGAEDLVDGGGERVKLTSSGNLPVELRRTGRKNTNDMIIWALAKRNARLFEELEKYLDKVPLFKGNNPFQGIDVYENLKNEVNTWMLDKLATKWDAEQIEALLKEIYGDVVFTKDQIDGIIKTYFLESGDGDGEKGKPKLLPYFRHIYQLRKQVGVRDDDKGRNLDTDAMIKARLTEPALCELIWSYWMEEGMLFQTMQSICLRFQNKQRGGGRDPLAALNTSPLRPLSNLLWGYIQAEPERLSVRRRNYEYDHHYGFFLHGKAVQDFEPADSRKTFIEAFNTLLHQLTRFYRQFDDTTVVADAFPVRNALRDVHLILSEGAHNQYGDLPWTARREMFIEQFILSRVEMREFLGGRSMVPYNEPWMEAVDTMKRMQNWSDTSIEQFATLARTGEDIILSIRFGDWNAPDIIPESAHNWATAYRTAVQEYIHSYRAVTGIDLTNKDQVDRIAPSIHLRKKLEAQTGRAA